MKKRRCLLAISAAIVLVSTGLMACGTDDKPAVTEKDNSAKDTTIAATDTQTWDTDETDGIEPTCTWEDVDIFLPDNWEGAYLTIEEEDNIAFYQKASYEEYEGSGYLFGISKSEEWLNYYVSGETMLAYTDDGMMYYLIQPTDVPVTSDDENVMNEYVAMANQVPQIKANFRIEAEGVHLDASQYQIPVSSMKYIEQSDLVNMTDNQLWIAKNEIYARHGRVFENEYLQNYFNSCSWYSPIEGKSEITDDELSEIEKANLEQIVAMEDALDEQYPYPQEYELNTEVKAHLLGTEETNTIIYKVMEQGTEFEYDYVLSIDGTEYDLKDYIYMVSPVTDAFYITNLSSIPGDVTEDEDGLEIAVLDDGPSSDPVTHFFKYDGTLHYLGEISGFPFKEQNNGWNGFTNLSGVYGTVRFDLIETAYLRGYWWYDSTNMELVSMDIGWYDYEYLKPHELFMDAPLYTFADSSADTVLLTKQDEVYFLQSDLEAWILVRGKDGTEGYIFIEDGNIENVGKPAEEVFSDLAFFD